MGCISNAYGGFSVLPITMQMQSLPPSHLIPLKHHILQPNRYISTRLLCPNPCYKLSIQGSSYSYSRVGFGTGGIFNNENVFTRRSRTIISDGGKSMAVVLSAIGVPILMVLVTVIVSIIVSEKLDREFEQEIARRRAWMERRGIQQDTLDGAKEERDRVLSPARKRPKREE